MRLIAIAMAPALALVWVLYARSQYRPEDKRLVAWLFVLGGAATMAALVLNHSLEKYTDLYPESPLMLNRFLFWVVGIGLNEEFAKMAVLLAVLYPRKDFVTGYQGLLGAATVALGFAAVENLIYLERYGTATLLLRSALTVPAHAGFSIPMGVLAARAKRAQSPQETYKWLAAGLMISIGLHGTYDWWLSMNHPVWSNLAYVQLVLTIWLGWRLLVFYTPLPPLPDAVSPDALPPGTLPPDGLSADSGRETGRETGAP